MVQSISDPSSLEALACPEGLALADDLSLSRIVVASDCQVVMNEIEQGSTGAYGAIIREIKERRNHFDKYNLVYERRNFNFDAHSLSKHVVNLGVGRHVWLGIPYDPAAVPVNIVSE